jgi:hypothetical protein
MLPHTARHLQPRAGAPGAFGLSATNAAPHLDGAAAEDSFLPHPLPQRSATLGRTIDGE